MMILVKRLSQIVGSGFIMLGCLALLSPTLFMALVRKLPHDISAAIVADNFMRAFPLSWSLIVVGVIVLIVVHYIK